MNRRFVLTVASLCAVLCGFACTSMIVSAGASASGRPLMWKHRDTGTEHNFVERVPARTGGLGYVALFNGGDSLLSEAWMGMNDAGFAIMNTASYNLAPDTARLKDREGAVMTMALRKCRRIEDFASLLDTLPKPMGVQANFGVIDAYGSGAYFETDDYSYVKFDLADATDGVLIRTNHSFTGNDTDGYGYIRYCNACDILAEEISTGQLSPEAFTEKASRSFWHSLLKKDFAASGDRWVIDQDFIPRNISSASIVIEGVVPGESLADMTMWTVIGYPPCSHVEAVTLDHVPDGLRPVADGFHSPDCDEAVKRKHMAFPIDRGSGPHYIDMDYLRPVMESERARSIENYNKGRNKDD